MAKAYEFLSQLSPLTLAHQQKGTIAGAALDKGHPARKIQLGNYTLNVSFARSWGTTQNPEYAAAIIMPSGDGEYMVAGKGVSADTNTRAAWGRK